MRKWVQVLAVLLFLVGSSGIAWQLYGNAYDDLPSFYWATHLAFENKVSAYQPEAFHELSQTLNRKIYPFLYPPPSVLLFSPFLLGDYEQVKAIVSVINLVLWWLLMWVTYQLHRFHTGGSHSRIAVVLIPLWLVAFTPVIDTVRTGQVNLLVFACLAPLLFQPKRRVYQYASGVLLALAILLKAYLLVLLPVLLLLRQKNILRATLTTLMLFCLASLLVLPKDLWTDWLRLSGHSGGYGKQLPDVLTIPWNQSINGFFIRQYLDKKILSGTTVWPQVIYLVCGGVLLTTIAIVWRYLRPHDHGVSLAVALSLLVMTLVAPLTWLHHFVFALPAVVCSLALLARCRKGFSQNIVSACVWLVAVFLSYPWLANLAFSGNEMKFAHKSTSLLANLLLSVPLLAGLGLWLLFCAIIVWQDKAKAGGSQKVGFGDP